MTAFDAVFAAPAAAVALRFDDGALAPIAHHRWLEPAAGADDAVADAAVGPVLDIGCGPGRMLAALSARGTDALGIDSSPAAVALARARGRRAVLRSVFDDVPRAGEWVTALLLDGSIGIGGDPVALLRRARALLAPEGTILAEVEPPGTGTRAGRVRLEGRHVSHWFDWAHVDTDGVAAVAEEAGLAVLRRRRHGNREFAWLA